MSYNMWSINDEFEYGTDFKFNNKEFKTYLDTMIDFNGQILVSVGCCIWYETGIYTERSCVWL